MKKDKLDEAVKIFRKAGGVLTTSESTKLGIHTSILYKLRDLGYIERLNRGLYQLKEGADVSLFQDWVPVLKTVKRGVICLISALAYHEITTQIPHYVYLALPAHSKRHKIAYPPIRYFWYSDKALQTGVLHRKVGGVDVRVFNMEKTLVDCVKYRGKIGMDVMLEALKMYWSSGNTNIDKLFEYADMFRVTRVLKPIMETIVSG